jgi:ribosomal protein L11 methyltransferase
MQSRPSGCTVTQPHDSRRSPWLVLSALVPPAGEEFLLVDALRRIGARAVEREGERVVAWLTAPHDAAALLRDASAAVRASTSMTEPALAWEWRSHDAWVERWVRDAEPRRVTPRVVVVPLAYDDASHDECDDRFRDDVVIRLEAGIAFGNSEHATTRGCLQLLERVLHDGDTVLDIGTGSGILAVAAALLGAHRVIALETDVLSCDSARRNIAANDVADRVDVRELHVTAADLHDMPRCDVILANLQADVIFALLPALHAALAPGGVLVVAGVTAGELASLLERAAAAGLAVLARETVDGWPCLALTPRTTVHVCSMAGCAMPVTRRRA